MPKTHTLAETYNKKARSKDTMTIQPVLRQRKITVHL